MTVCVPFDRTAAQTREIREMRTLIAQSHGRRTETASNNMVQRGDFSENMERKPAVGSRGGGSRAFERLTGRGEGSKPQQARIEPGGWPGGGGGRFRF